MKPLIGLVVPETLRHFVIKAVIPLVFLLPFGCAKSPQDRGWKCTVELQTNSLSTAIGANDRRAIINVLDRRIQEGHEIEPSAKNPNQIIITVPRVLYATNAATLRGIITAIGVLEFRLVHPESDRLLKLNIVEPGYEVLKREATSPDGSKFAQAILVEKKPAGGLTALNLKKVLMDRDFSDRLLIKFELDSPGSDSFAKLTRENINRQLAIVVDGQLRSAPVIKAEISGGQAAIEGGPHGFAVEEARALFSALQNPLPVPIKIVEEHLY